MTRSSDFPHPELAKRAIWEGRAARRRAAASTDRRWASHLLSLFHVLALIGTPWAWLGAFAVSASAPPASVEGELTHVWNEQGEVHRLKYTTAGLLNDELKIGRAHV